LVPAVVELTARADEPAICIATGAHSPWVDVLVGDVAQQLLRAVDAPVLLVGPHCRTDARDGPVVVAHDGLRNDDAVLGAAGSWAAALGVRPVVLHVYQPLSGDLDDVMPTLRAACAHVGAGDVKVVRGTFPAGAIREYAHEVGASLLALSTHGRTETLTASAGRTARWVVRESPCPVLIAHPS
jgi:nucleotide-binding universal stress UspA family protein